MIHHLKVALFSKVYNKEIEMGSANSQAKFDFKIKALDNWKVPINNRANFDGTIAGRNSQL